MSDEPVVDERTRAELLERLHATADDYTDEWDPDSDDVGTTLFEVFSRFEADVVKRLNAVPQKHRVAFLSELGFDRRPPQAARLPLTFETAGDVDRNVVVPGGTQATAETEDGGSTTFEIPQDGGFEATPAELTEVYGVVPDTDTIVDHGAVLDAGRSVTLFTGTDRQGHRLYLGHDDLLTLAAGSTLTVVVLTDATGAVLEESLDWEYYGENEDGDVGWHPLVHETEEAQDLSESDASLPDMWDELRDRIHEFSSGDPSEWGDNSFELAFRLPGPTEPREVDGVESRWIRVSARGEDADSLGMEFESVAVSVRRGGEDGPEDIPPDTVLSNDVPLSVGGDEDLVPFGRNPQPPTTLYVDSGEALTKPGAAVSLEFTPPARGDSEDQDDGDEEGDGGGEDARLSPAVDYGVVSGGPEISWEYWNGNGWARLDLRSDGTDAFTRPGTVSFTVPRDLERTSVSGHEGHWIRARLVSGNYGQPRYEITEDGGRGDLVERPDPPRFGRVRVSYDQGGEPFEHVVTDNNLEYRRPPPGLEADSFVPFVGTPDDEQTLYLGFDAPLEDGPVPLYFPVGDVSYPRGFDPEIRWEYCTDPLRDVWEPLDVRDGTDGLTERGIVLFSVPGETRRTERFGTSRHWIRARVSGDEFSSGAAGSQPDSPGSRPRENAPGAASGTVGRPSEEGSGLPEGGAVRPPPTLSAIHPNTQWAHNARTIEDERLGSSDGSPTQTFECGNAPVTEVTVWVDELSDLSEAQRRGMIDRRPADVERVEQAGDTVQFWVRWTEVDDFLDSSKTDRHYTVDRTAGTVTFGDGQRGTIPPSGENNVRATYKTGGGSEGNVEVGAVDSLRTAIALIDSVTNLEPGDGGADVETMDAATTRGSARLRTGGRAVTASDFEAVARAASRELAVVKCDPGTDGAGRPSGSVTLIVVPRERRARPTPSVDLRQRVEAAVSERAPASLTAGDDGGIVVQGPRYAPVSVEATLSTAGTTSITALKETATGNLDAYLHPLTGGLDGDGWQFGAVPRPSQVETVLQGIDGVDSVETLALWVQFGGERIRIPPGRPPTLPFDALICTGDHEVTVTMTGTRSDRGAGTRADRRGAGTDGEGRR